MKLSEIQQQFSARLPYLMLEIARQGYLWTTGHALRCEECPVGSASSKHKRKLAIDINLFKDGEYLTSTEDHRPFGEYWQSLGGIWGGDFNDGNHYEWPDAGRPEMPIDFAPPENEPETPDNFESEALSVLLSIEGNTAATLKAVNKLGKNADIAASALAKIASLKPGATK